MKHSFFREGNIPKQIKGGNLKTMKKLSVIFFALLFLLGMATAAFAATYNDVTTSAYWGTENTGADMEATLSSGDADFDNDIINANASGVGVGTQAEDQSVIKSQGMFGGTQRTHGEYQNNTNSCASCHQTHTASGDKLLFKDSVYHTCTACHDGTLGFYNVFDSSTAGTFDGTQDGNASMHLVTGTESISAAPGGNLSGTKAGWTSGFNCASCHAPHGSYSDRLLHYNPNKIQSTRTDLDAGGKQTVNLNVYGANGAGVPTASAAANGAKIVVLDTPANIAAIADLNLTSWTGTHAAAHADAADYVALVVYEASDKWAVATTPWLYGYDSYSSKIYFSILKNDDVFNKNNEFMPAKYTENGVHYEFGNGFAYINHEYTTGEGGTLDLTTVDYADISNPIIVKFEFDATPIVDFGGVEITKVLESGYIATGKGVAISAFCAACHVDYMNHSSNEPTTTGTYQQAYRHSADRDSYTCLRCHFAHGTDVTVMKDAMDKNLDQLTISMGNADDAKAYLLDNNASSALKRYTNMAVCWKCHTDSHAEQLKNNTDFWENYDNRPHGF